MAYEFTFDDYSLAGISSTLTTLDLSFCRVSTVKQLYFLDGLDNLKLNNNNITDLNDEVLYMINTMKRLRTLDLRNNDVTKSTLKYRDHVIMVCYSVQELDGKEVKDQQRKYLSNLANEKQKRRRNSENMRAVSHTEHMAMNGAPMISPTGAHGDKMSNFNTGAQKKGVFPGNYSQ